MAVAVPRHLALLRHCPKPIKKQNLSLTSLFPFGRESTQHAFLRYRVTAMLHQQERLEIGVYNILALIKGGGPCQQGEGRGRTP